jgi:hypothetical protein
MDRLLLTVPDVVYYQVRGNRLHVEAFSLPVETYSSLSPVPTSLLEPATYSVSVTHRWYGEEQTVAAECRLEGATLRVRSVVLPVSFRAHSKDRIVEICVEQTNLPVPYALAGYGVWREDVKMRYRDVPASGTGMPPAERPTTLLKRTSTAYRAGLRKRPILKVPWKRALDRMVEDAREMLLKTA